jgi:hypothetical protein
VLDPHFIGDACPRQTHQLSEPAHSAGMNRTTALE